MKVVGVGAGGHAKVLMDIVFRHPEYELIGMIDRNPDLWGTQQLGVPVLGGYDELRRLWEKGEARAAFVGVGGVPQNLVRRGVHDLVKGVGFPIVQLVHPTAAVAHGVQLGEGVMLMAGAIVNPDAQLGPGVIVNTGALVEHDCVVGAFAHVCPGARLAGNVTIGEESFIGLGSMVIQGVRIGARAVVGAGAVVLRDVPDDTTVVGCPAAVVKRAPVV